jgi:SAM-dependent methyltransferase
MNRYAHDAAERPKSFYDARYAAGYMKSLDYDVFESCRAYTLRRVLTSLRAKGFAPTSALDYGCGEGRYLDMIESIFPKIALSGCDISDVGLAIAKTKHPKTEFRSMRSEAVEFPGAAFDLIISIEVLEHVQDVHLALREIARMLRYGGLAVITTPCANRYSVEWFINKWRGGLQPTPDGYGRFATDEPGHLRRLNDDHLHQLAHESGIRVQRIYHRAHFFTALVERRPLKWLQPFSARRTIALLDWHFFKHLPNGATMLAILRRTETVIGPKARRRPTSSRRRPL